MAAPCFIAWNGVMPTTGPILTQPTYTGAGFATTARTLLQVVPAANQKMRLIEWGYTIDTSPANNVRMELVETGTVAATVVAHVSAGVMPYNDSGAVSLVQLGTSLTGYCTTIAATATTEGSITSTRLFDYHYENGLYTQRMWPLSREPEVGAARVMRIRATGTAASAVNISCYLVWEE